MSAEALAGRIENARQALADDALIVERLDLVALGTKAPVLPDLATDQGCHELAVLAAYADVVMIDELAGLEPKDADA